MLRLPGGRRLIDVASKSAVGKVKAFLAKRCLIRSGKLRGGENLTSREEFAAIVKRHGFAYDESLLG
jgi:hypothetical protein